MFSVLSSASLGYGGFMSDSCRELQRIDTLSSCSYIKIVTDHSI